MIRFKRFRFDVATARLWEGDQRLALRPKSALLLEALVSQPGRVFAKEELVRAVWGHECVEDQALFQLVSEIRQALRDRDCIATFPNRGYRWNWPVSHSRGSCGPLWAAAAGVAVAVALAVTLGLSQSTSRTALPSEAALLSPALVAVSQGVQARIDGRLGDAERLLRLAVQANPHFAAAKLELSDLLRERGDLETAVVLAHDALSDSRIVGDHYLEATAHVLLSQLRLTQGDLAGALRLNAEAARIAEDHGHVCAAQVSAAWQQRLALALIQPERAVQPAPVQEQSALAACEAALLSPQSSLYGDPPLDGGLQPHLG